ncbi:MAG: hypothetical protein BYD32DRAFT_85995 [Podila humilis]|nr:MAG: hypothetical protein BYD32DRAFT_85995 [Podila humilis]
MANNKQGKTERYSAQIRASQYDPDLNDDVFSYQSTNNPPLERSMVLGSQYYHGPGSAASSSSATNTLINLHTNSQNSSTGALPESLKTSVPSPPQSTTAHVLSAAPIPPNTNNNTSSSSTTPFSIFPASILRKTQHSKSQSHSQALSGTGPTGTGPGPRGPTGFAHHAKTGSVASTRSKLIARVSRSSLQLNLRTSQPSLHPVLSPSPVQSPGGTWDGPNLTPSPMFPSGVMDPVFMKEQQMQYSQGVGVIGGGGVPRYSKEMHRNSMMSFILNRQDDGRLQLEQERQYQRKRILKTWTRSKFVLLLANTLVSKMRSEDKADYKKERDVH